MQPNEKSEFAKILTGLSAIKPGSKLTPEALEIFWLAMSGWTLPEFRNAASHLARSVEFMPNPYHFEQLRKAGQPTAGEAFAKAVKHCASSAYREGPHPDPVVDACVRALGGYMVIAMCDEDKLPFLEKRFAEHYEHLSDAIDAREALPEMTSRQRLIGPKPITALLKSA